MIGLNLLYIIQTFEHNKGFFFFFRFLIVKNFILFALCILCVIRKTGLTQLTFDIGPLIGTGCYWLTSLPLLVQPLHKTFHVDLTHCTRTLTRANQGIFCFFFIFPQAYPTDQRCSRSFSLVLIFFLFITCLELTQILQTLQLIQRKRISLRFFIPVFNLTSGLVHVFAEIFSLCLI